MVQISVVSQYQQINNYFIAYIYSSLILEYVDIPSEEMFDNTSSTLGYPSLKWHFTVLFSFMFCVRHCCLFAPCLLIFWRSISIILPLFHIGLITSDKTINKHLETQTIVISNFFGVSVTEFKLVGHLRTW